MLTHHARPVPRYTSYPTAAVWTHNVRQRDFDLAVAGAREPIGVYVHLPFCREACAYCGCAMVPAAKKEAGARYLRAMTILLERLPLPDGCRVDRLHFGGGTPTWFSPADLCGVFALLRARFAIELDAEVSVEVHPDVTTDAHLEALRGSGVNRISVGIQSFDREVLAAIGRVQDPDEVDRFVASIRSHGFEGLNFDLVYGLPRQTLDSLTDTLRRSVALGPDRLAIYGFAWVPSVRPHQKAMANEKLPGLEERFALAAATQDQMRAAGYVPVGFDHFAKPHDPLAQAAAAGRLGRDFMGYTTRRGGDLLGLGMSAISQLGDLFVQQHAKLGRWWNAVESGADLVEKGMRLSADDRLRAEVIERILCDMRVPYNAVEQAHGIAFRETFAAELGTLAPLEADGLVALGGDHLAVTESGRLLSRNIAAAFDRYLRRGTTYSAAV